MKDQLMFTFCLKFQKKLNKDIYIFIVTSKDINLRKNKHLYSQIAVFEMNSTLCLELLINSIFINVTYVTILYN